MPATLDTLQSSVNGLTLSTSTLVNVVTGQKTLLDTALATATAKAAAAAASEAQAETARDQAVAGLGAADQSVNLAQLTYATDYAVLQAGLANKRLNDVHDQMIQSGTATITQAASTELVRNYATATVTLPKAYADALYQVEVECISATPALGHEGSVIVQSRATNSFVLAITGSATLASLRWKTIHPAATAPARAFEGANSGYYFGNTSI